MTRARPQGTPNGRRPAIFTTGACPEPVCHGKMRYPSRKHAKEAARRLHIGEKLNAYKCGDYWHLGHLPPAITDGRLPRSSSA